MLLMPMRLLIYNVPWSIFQQRRLKRSQHAVSNCQTINPYLEALSFLLQGFETPGRFNSIGCPDELPKKLQEM